MNTSLKNKIKHNDCPLCGGVATDYLAFTRDLHYGISGEWSYQKCTNCKVVFLNPSPTSKFLSDAYDDSYYSYQDFDDGSIFHKLARWLLGSSPYRTKDPYFSKPGRILDIGCGSGQFLFKMKRAGWETAGVELSRVATEIGNAKHSLNIQSGTIHEAKFPRQYFDYIRLNHSFEHLLDPCETLDCIYNLLKPEGMLFIGVPNTASLQAKLFGRHWWNLGPPVHPFNYSPYTLNYLLSRHGFEIVRWRTNSNFAGFLGSIQLNINESKGIFKDSGGVIRNTIAKLFFNWVAKFVDLFRCGDCLEVVARKKSTSDCITNY